MANTKSNSKQTQKVPTKSKKSGLFVGNNQHAIATKFGHAIRARRELSGITQTELAKHANLNRSYLSELEHGLTNISLDRAERIAKALGCTLRDLLD